MTSTQRKLLQAVVRDGLKIQSRFSAAPVYAATGQGSLKSEGVEAAVHYPRALNQQPTFAGGQVRLPNCEWLTERIMSLPVHPMLSAISAALSPTCVNAAWLA